MGFTELPACLQAARQPRRRPFARSVERQKSQNNYLAEAKPRDLQKTHSVTEADHPKPILGGRNAKGAGAPLGNRNARGGALYRLCRKRMRLKRQQDQQRYHLLALAAAIAHLEDRAASSGPPIFSQNNYLAEGGAPIRAVPCRTPSPPSLCRYNNYLARYRPDSRQAGGAGGVAPQTPYPVPDPSRISRIPSVKRLDAMVAGLYGRGSAGP